MAKASGAGIIKSDALGNIYVGGGFLTKYNAAGGQLWQSTLSQPGIDAMVVDTSDNVYTVGSSTGGDNCVYTATYAIKYNAQGKEQWVNYFITNPGCGYTGVNLRIALDGAQNLYVASSYENDAVTGEIAVNKLSPTNVIQWTSTYPYREGGLAALGLHVDAVGNAYVTGRIDSFQTPTNGNVLTLKYAAPDFCTATGSILQELWTNVPGSTIASIPVSTPPTSTSQLTIFRTAANYGDNYGQRIRGYICAPTTGSYRFFMQGDDKAELFLSSDANPANKVKIATVASSWSWTQTAIQQSAPINLVAGKRYYVEVLHKESTGADVLRIGWRTPQMATNAEPVIIPGSHLSPFQNPTQTPTDLTASPYLPNGAIAVQWKNVRDETGYVLERATAPTGPFARIGTLSPAPDANTYAYYSDKDIVAGTTYYYRVYATSAQGATTYSNVASANLPSVCTASGTILRELWANVPGSTIASIPINTPPTSTDQLTIFRTAAGYGDNYGQRIRGYICAPVSGSYRFFMQGDDKAELFLSSDANPANKVEIATVANSWSWTQTAAQQSAPINLLAGQRYYVEVLHKEGTGADVLRIGWRTPQMAIGSEPVVIPGSNLSPFVPASNSLLACYSFSGNANDGSSHGNHGTVNGGATLTTDRFGNPNSAYAFDGVDDYISLSANQLQPYEYTYSMWAKPATVLSSDTYYSLFSIGSNGGDQSLTLLNNYLGNAERTGWLMMSAYASGSDNRYITGSLPAPNAWYHLVMTRSASNMKLYVNGTLVGSVATTAASPFYGYGPVTAFIGSRYISPYYFQGVLDDVQVYNYPLSAAEVSALYQKTGNLCPGNQAARSVEEREEKLSSLLKASPNPTTGATKVEFTAAETGWLGVQLYNLQGQPLQQLFGQEVEAGSTHHQQFDATSLPSGLYLLRMVNAKRVQHHKLLVSY